ncbi:hypothetical protein ACUXG4_004419 [Cupriavidus metallidurans]|jgi:hypothetical protein|nr:hypothetical protein AU374_03291 [Cupriavidus metallidurans]
MNQHSEAAPACTAAAKWLTGNSDTRERSKQVAP